MVKKCRGLPLAVVVLGGLLATKKSLKEWEVVHGSINAQFVKWEQHHQYGGVYGILALSYHDLPFHLKPCFLYLSQFPEDWEFKKRELIRMWIAEGFILQSSIGGEETMEDVGEEYLEELVSRCVVQVSQRDHTGIGVKRCRIHDLVRDMCISKARDENFLGVMQHTEDAVTNSSSSTLQLTSSIKWRRIAIHPRISGNDAIKWKFYVPLLKSGDSHLRSLFYFNEDVPTTLGNWAFDSFEVRLEKLRHLETLKCVQAEYLIKTDAVRKLINLRNLSIEFEAKEEVEVVLRSPIFELGRLRSLKMLMLMGMPMESFPNLEPLSSLHRLTKVELWGAIPEDPHSLHHNLEYLPASLAKLTLIYSQLKRDPMGILEKLPNLRF
ncbi:hypothetical protein GH714_011940 [Hevea brasiliensis]|uniref:Disease resistance protein winged helix domain-containing protein n=1 Tax=Hevea brasiliensis TaxID=3981 RepID=A0A6A6MZP9_HEVBR|nr:hypothetical protein GH714_011940 [Hevea brasiliensis]